MDIMELGATGELLSTDGAANVEVSARSGWTRAVAGDHQHD
jgi:hypothetical protein